MPRLKGWFGKKKAFNFLKFRQNTEVKGMVWEKCLIYSNLDKMPRLKG